LTLDGYSIIINIYECYDRPACLERLDEQNALIKLPELEDNYKNGSFRHYNKSQRWDARNGFTGK